MIVGTGIDIVFIPRIEQIVNKHGQRFLNRAFHPYEIQTFQSQNKNKGIEFLASRWAVKESVYKAIYGQKRVPFPEIRLEKSASGKPLLVVEGKTEELFRSLGIKSSFVSISHHQDYAVANVILTS